jgi:hypothetical protein
MEKKNKKNNNGYFKIPEYFFDYGLQVFTHTEYDILAYILRNIIGWNDGRIECELSIKNMALMRHYSEKNIIKAIKNLIEKTNVFSKVVYREKGSCIKKTKYIITENSVNILNDYVRKNIPTDFETKKENLKNRSLEAIERIEQEKQSLTEKQQHIIDLIKENETIENSNVSTTSNEDIYSDYLLECWQATINTFGLDKWDDSSFKEHKEFHYKRFFDCIPKETNDEKIDIRLSDLIRFTTDLKTIDFLNTLIKNKKMVGGQSNYFYLTLKIGFKFNGRNLDRINVIYE